MNTAQYFTTITSSTSNKMNYLAKDKKPSKTHFRVSKRALRAWKLTSKKTSKLKSSRLKRTYCLSQLHKWIEMVFLLACMMMKFWPTFFNLKRTNRIFINFTHKFGIMNPFRHLDVGHCLNGSNSRKMVSTKKHCRRWTWLDLVGRVK